MNSAKPSTMADSDSDAESLRLRISAMDLNSETIPTTPTAELASHPDGAPSCGGGGEKDVFYDDDGLVLDNLGFESVVFVDNLPIVDHESARELESDVKAIFGAVGVIKGDGFSMPVNLRTLETLGHCFIEFNTPQEAELATKNIDGFKYGKNSLSVTSYEDLYKPEQTKPDFESYVAEIREDDCSESDLSEEDDE